MVVFYSLERHTFESNVRRFAPSNEPCASRYTVVCHCLNVTRNDGRAGRARRGARSLCELACMTGAGGGCTACHRRLRHYLVDDRRRSTGRSGDGPARKTHWTTAS